MHERIHNLVSSVTEGLKDDPELRLDVQAELAAHLEERARDAAAGGLSEEEAAEEAVTAFGAPLDLAAALLESNKGRMKLRALIRLAIKAVLVPAAVVVAVLIGYGTLARVTTLANVVMDITRDGDIPISIRLPEIPRLPIAAGQSQGQPDALIALRAVKREDWWRAQWEARKGTPEEHILYVQYTLHRKLIDSPHAMMVRFNDTSIKQEPFDRFARDMRLGEEIDPRNALYHYQMARAYLNVHCMESRASKPRLPDDQTVLTDDLYDPVDFARGVAEVRRAYRKPVYAFYSKDFRRLLFAGLPAPRLVEDYYHYSNGGANLFPVFATNREMARRLTALPRLLRRQGNEEAAEALLRDWDRFPVQLLRGADTLSELLTADAIARGMGEDAAITYEEWGQPEQARQVREKVERMAHPRRSRIPVMRSEEVTAFMRRYAPLSMGGMAMLGFRPTIDEMAPARRFEQTMMQQLAFGLIVLLLTLYLSAMGAAQLIWHYRLRATGATPLLLLPSRQESAHILGYGVLLPIALYALYTHLPFIGGQQYGLAVTWPRVIGELLLLAGVLLVLPASMAGQMIRRRCHRLGVPAPPATRRVPVLPIILAAAAIGVFVWTVVAISTYWEKLKDILFLLSPWAFTGLALALLLISYGVFRLLHWRRGADHYAVYRGTIARSLLPIYAVTIILLSLTARPYLTHSEIKYLREDRVVFPKPDTFGQSPFDYQIVRQLKAETLEAAGESADW